MPELPGFSIRNPPERAMTEHMTKTELHALDKKLAITAERMQIANHLETVAKELLHNKESDAVDGYVAAALIEIAKVIRTGGHYDGLTI